MEELIKLLSQTLADTFVMYFKAHSAHWNIEGPNFPQYHKFLEDIYTELHGAVDPIAEEIRALDSYAPSTLASLLAMATVTESMPSNSRDIFQDLLDSNNLILVTLMRAYQAAEKQSEMGLSNFIQDRIDIHNKHGWMLKALLK